MKRILFLPVILAAFWGGALAAAGSTNTAATNRVLLVESSSMPVGGGSATLTIGPLQRTGGVYTGDYKIQVAPYFFKSEKGRLAIVVSDESLARISQGRAEAVIGTATAGGKGGATRHIDATATPVDANHGTLKVLFATGGRNMIFEPAYHFAEKAAAGAVPRTTGPDTTANLQRRLPASPHKTPDAASLYP
jgi:hypothetical protein